MSAEAELKSQIDRAMEFYFRAKRRAKERKSIEGAKE